MKVIIAGEQSTYKSLKERILNRLRFGWQGSNGEGGEYVKNQENMRLYSRRRCSSFIKSLQIYYNRKQKQRAKCGCLFV